MPIYVYECKSCGDVAEQLILKHEDPDPCKCGSTALVKCPTTASARFVGAGWGGTVEIANGKAHMRVVQGD